jgi:DNA-binding transcriptional MerR regulator
MNVAPAQPFDERESDSISDTKSRVKKAPNAFRTISEVADELHIPQHVLRFWETKFPQVKPLKRGGGRRYYRPDDIALLRRISGLLYVQGYTIKGVQRLLREGGGRLSDDIPPPTAEDLATEDVILDGLVPDHLARDDQTELLESDEPQLPMPGLTPRPRAAAEPGHPRRPRAATPSLAPIDLVAGDTEAARLRAVLRETLRELEALRAMLA